MATEIILCDLDSTLANTRHRHGLVPRSPEARRKPGAWDAFALACYDDEVMEGTAVVLRLLAENYPIYIVSGRGQIAYGMTAAWLQEKAVVPYESLRLHRGRENGDDYNNADYKVNYVAQLRAEDLNPILMLEDWPEVAMAMRSIGVPTICINPMYDDLAMTEFAKAVKRTEGV